jgi:hypothetical protein
LKFILEFFPFREPSAKKERLTPGAKAQLTDAMRDPRRPGAEAPGYQPWGKTQQQQIPFGSDNKKGKRLSYYLAEATT